MKHGHSYLVSWMRTMDNGLVTSGREMAIIAMDYNDALECFSKYHKKFTNMNQITIRVEELKTSNEKM